MIIDCELKLSDDPDLTREDQMDVSRAEVCSIKYELTEQDRSCESHTKYLCYYDRSDHFQAWVTEPNFAHIYLALKGRILRVCIHKNPKDGLFHCACGLELATVEAAQRHGRENQVEDHSTDFFDLFTGSFGNE